MSDNHNESSSSLVSVITIGIIIIFVFSCIFNKIGSNDSGVKDNFLIIKNSIIITVFAVLALVGLFLLIFSIISLVVFFDKASKSALVPYIEEIQNYCKKNGIKFEETMSEIPDSFSILSSINPDCCLNNRKNYVTYTYVMKGKSHNLCFYIFDNKLCIPGRRSYVHYIYKSICIIKKTDLNLPVFYINDKDTIIDSLIKIFDDDYDYDKGEVINISEDKTFSRKFVLQGQVEKDVDNYFNNEKIRKSFVDNHIKGYSYEGNKEYLVISSLNTVTKREKYGVTKLENRLKMLDCAVKIMTELD